MGRPERGGWGHAFDAELATDGIAEVIDVIAPFKVSVGHAPRPQRALRFEAIDTGATWTHGPGRLVGTVAATAQDLLLLLRGRVSPAARTGEAFVWQGDQKRALRLPDVPVVP
jgi:hypothetical protein